ncbi:MAG TPA: hypothetical protein VE775_00155, partial [Pyrinomonadaceae bacterium]|nr:hypothetical protein [Pyrinomonadaceae bacterium]
KRLATLRDAVYEWTVEENGQAGQATTRTKAPGAAFVEIKLARGTYAAGATARSVWTRSFDGAAQTLTDAQARSARLQARLDATRLADYKRQNLLALAVGADTVAGEPAYVVEFRSRDAARVRYLFGAQSKLLLRTTDEARALQIDYADYRAENGLLEPHRVAFKLGDAAPLTLKLQSARYNTNLADASFDAPHAETLDVAKLVNEVIEREPVAGIKFEEYTYSVKQTEQELNDKGEAKKETTRVWDVFLAPNGHGIGKLVSINGAPLPAERAAKEEKRVVDFLTANEKSAPQAQEQRGRGGFHITMGAYGFDLADLLRACEFVAPRRERFQGREAVVFDYRPRAEFRTKSKNDEILSKLNGIIWIDPVDKVVMRIEARLSGDFKVGGGLLMKIKPGAGFVFERQRLPDGFWVPRIFLWNADGKGFLVMSMSVYETTEWYNFKRFKTEAGDATLNAPKVEP